MNVSGSRHSATARALGNFSPTTLATSRTWRVLRPSIRIPSQGGRWASGHDAVVHASKRAIGSTNRFPWQDVPRTKQICQTSLLGRYKTNKQRANKASRIKKAAYLSAWWSKDFPPPRRHLSLVALPDSQSRSLASDVTRLQADENAGRADKKTQTQTKKLRNGVREALCEPSLSLSLSPFPSSSESSSASDSWRDATEALKSDLMNE